MTAPLILVDETNVPVGLASWEDAHAFPEGKLHRAFSVYIFRNNGTEILIQRRSQSKLFAGLWANSCCSHPREGEEIAEAAMRRLQEELGFTCTLATHSSFIYQTQDPDGCGAENEHVTILRGDPDKNVTVTPNLMEIAEWKWAHVNDLRNSMREFPNLYALWFRIGLEKLLDATAVKT